jgi:dihydrofolate reductase
MKAIAAMAENRGIGKNGGMPWAPIKSDFKWFKEFTIGKILIVGRKTFESLPPLRDRNFVVLTSCNKGYEDGYHPIYNYAYCHKSYDEIVEILKHQREKLICAGGAKTYELFLSHITEFYITHIKGIYESDVFMPPFEHFFTKQEVIKEFDGHRVIKYSR